MRKYHSLDVDFWGIIDAKLRDLKGYATFAFELIQNADDAPDVTEVAFDLSKDGIHVVNNGSFRDKDFERLAKIASGGKREESGTIGAFGIGFISVYQITDTPQIISAGKKWDLHPERDNPSERIDVEEVLDDGKTYFYFPWATDKNSIVRKKLNLETVNRKSFDILRRTLLTEIDTSILFLRKLEKITISVNGKIEKTIERIPPEGGVQVISINNEDQIWYTFEGNFENDANDLKTKYNGQIEKKRSSAITIAIPEETDRFNGYFYAFLPTFHRTNLPFHICGDFYPSSDRKRILLDSDYQGEWNKRATLEAAKTILANIIEIRNQLGHKAFFEFLFRTEAIHIAAKNSQQDEVLGAFWEVLEPELENYPVVFTSCGKWKKPSDQIFLLENQKEKKSTPVLSVLNIDVVHPDLNRYHNLLRGKSMKVPLLRNAQIADAIQKSGLVSGQKLKDAPKWFQDFSNRALLIDEIVLLRSRNLSESEKKEDETKLSECPIVVSCDSRLAAPNKVWLADSNTVRIFSAAQMASILASDSNPKEISHLVYPFDLEVAIDNILIFTNDPLSLEEPENPLEATWISNPASIYAIIDWIDSQWRKRKYDANIKNKILNNVRIWPSGKQLFCLSDLEVPGNFEDPLGLAKLLDPYVINKHHDLLNDLCVAKLSISKYILNYIDAQSLTTISQQPDLCLQLLSLFGRQHGEFEDNLDVRNILEQLPILECTDGVLRKASECYFQSQEVMNYLGKDVHVIKLNSNNQWLRGFLLWLGIPDKPRLKDIVIKIRSIIKNPPLEANREAIKELFNFIGTNWEIYKSENDWPILKNLPWLPAKNEYDEWFVPTNLYADYSEHLFSTQAQFLDCSKQEQLRGFIGDLGIHTELDNNLVIAHLLYCAENHRPIKNSRRLYQHLQDLSKKSDIYISRLIGKPCIWAGGTQFLEPSKCYWAENPFSNYRYHLDKEWRDYTTLFGKLGAREKPSYRDALDVMIEISNRFAPEGKSLDEDTSQVLENCWKIIEEADILIDKEWEILSSTKLVPNPDGILYEPKYLFFNDKPRLVAKFDPVLQNYVIERPKIGWRAMSKAGLGMLSHSVMSSAITLTQIGKDDALRKRIKERKPILERVVSAHKALNADEWVDIRWDELDCIQVSELEIQYSINILGRIHNGVSEIANVHIDHENGIIYSLAGKADRSWNSLAVELASWLNPFIEGGILSITLKEVLSASSTKRATENLDELGFSNFIDIRSESIDEETIAPPRDEDDEVASNFQPKDEQQVEVATDGTGTIVPDSEQSSLGHGLLSPGSRAALPKDNIASPTRGLGPADKNKPLLRKRLRSYVYLSNGPNDDADDKVSYVDKETDEKGIQAVLNYERSQNRNPDLMEHFNRGYDIESKDAKGIVIRYIEVKSLTEHWKYNDIEISAAQYKTAVDFQDRFWLYIVEKAKSSAPRIIRIQNPPKQIDKYCFDSGWEAAAEGGIINMKES